MITTSIPGKMTERTVQISAASVLLDGVLSVPPKAKGIVLFAHGSGSSRFSPRNNFVAKVLQIANIGTLLIDLLTEKEDEIYETRFDIELLTQRLVAVIHWLQKDLETKNLPIGLFGASTGAAAALKAAARSGQKIKAVVSRGGRPDLAIDELPIVACPVLLIIGGRDHEVIELNQHAFMKISTLKQIKVIPGATHLFEEEGALEEVAELARAWFEKYL